MKKCLLTCLLSFLFISSCGVKDALTGNVFDIIGSLGGDGGDSVSSENTLIEASATHALAVGGVAPGRNQLIITDENDDIRDFGNSTLEFSVIGDSVALEVRSGFDTFASGSGATMIPQGVGISTISFQVDGTTEDDTFQVTSPPQSLIQVLMGEARGQLHQEAETNDDGFVLLASRSPTADGLGAVIRRRVNLTEIHGETLFGVDPVEFSTAPFDAVIFAKNGSIYQFSPADPSDPTHQLFLDSQSRSFLSGIDHPAYDQAVLTSAGIFDERTDDPTGGSFAFKTPSVDEFECLKSTLNSGLNSLPDGCGTSDDNFPFFAPIQVLIHPDVALLGDDRPSFIFIRERTSSEPAVTDIP